MREDIKPKRYFEQMEYMIMNSPITFNEFAIYCKYLKLAVASGTLDNPLHYAFIIYHAGVLPNANKELYDMYCKELMDIMIAGFEKDLEKQGNDIDRYFDTMEREIKTKQISYEQFSDYCEKVQLANILKTDVDLVSCALALREADVQLPDKSTELLRFNKYYSMLVDYINENKKAKK